MNIGRREALGALAGAMLPAAAQPARKLNFVFVLIDDMGATDLGCYGSGYYESPSVDRLAATGMRFTNGYAACPVCSPTRAAIMTGKYPARLQLTDWIPGRKQWPTARLLTPEFNQQLPLEEVTIAEMLKPAGYVSASIGKWHLGGPDYYPDKQGFNLNVAGDHRGSPVPGYFGPWDLPNFKRGAKEDYLNDLLAGEAEKFLEQNHDKPFLLYLPNFAVHTPLQAKREMIAHFERKPAAGGHNRAVYAAMIKSMDEGVGRVLRKLEQLQLDSNTVVIFTSDNGGLRYEGRSKEAVTSNAPFRAGKGHLYEGGVRVPFIVRWPGVTRPGSVSDVPVSSIDFLPTIAGMAGLRLPAKDIDGVSIVPALKGAANLKRDALYWHYPHYSNQGGAPGGAVRSGRYKLIEFYEDNRLELYDLAEDPGESRNLARKLPAEAARLHGMLRRWRQSVKATMPAMNPAYDPAQAGQGLTGAEPKTDPI